MSLGIAVLLTARFIRNCPQRLAATYLSLIHILTLPTKRLV